MLVITSEVHSHHRLEIDECTLARTRCHLSSHAGLSVQSVNGGKATQAYQINFKAQTEDIVHSKIWRVCVLISACNLDILWNLAASSRCFRPARSALMSRHAISSLQSQGMQVRCLSPALQPSTNLSPFQQSSKGGE